MVVASAAISSARAARAACRAQPHATACTSCNPLSFIEGCAYTHACATHNYCEADSCLLLHCTLITRLYMASAIAKDRLPTAATASFEVDRYTAVGKNLHDKTTKQGLLYAC